MINGGPSEASNVTVIDPLPAGVTLSANATCVDHRHGELRHGDRNDRAGELRHDRRQHRRRRRQQPRLHRSGGLRLQHDDRSPRQHRDGDRSRGVGPGQHGDRHRQRRPQRSRHAAGRQGRRRDDLHARQHRDLRDHRSEHGDVGRDRRHGADALPRGRDARRQRDVQREWHVELRHRHRHTGQTTLGTTGAHIVPGGANTIVFLVPVGFAPGMSTNPLVNTASATDVPTGATASGQDSDTLSANVTLSRHQGRRQRDVHAGRQRDVHGHRQQHRRFGRARP